jgi:predicted metal-dependent phosphoesterase TrpH
VKKIDLHIHSTASDGEMTPEEIVDFALEKGLKKIAITDHEILHGSFRAIEYSKDKDLEVVPGVEIGVNSEFLGLYDLHIVGLFVDFDNSELSALMDRLKIAREVQKKEIIDNLNSLGYDITFDELHEEANGGSYGRPHIASILMRKYNQEFESFQSIFDELLGSGGKANVWQWKAGMKETIDIIHRAGGVAVLAHPLIFHDFSGRHTWENVVERFVEAGGDGVEVDYFYGKYFAKDEEESRRFVDLARSVALRNGLVVSGGGDFHKKSDPHEIGDYGLDEDEFLDLVGYWEEKWKL